MDLIIPVYVTLIGVVGLIIFVRARRDNSSLFPMLYAVGILASDLQLYAVKFEYELILLIVAFGLIITNGIRLTRPSPEKAGQLSRFLHAFTYGALMLYLILQSVRGAFVHWRGMSAFHWAIFFVLLSYLAAYPLSSVPRSQSAAVRGRRLLTRSLCIYVALFLFLSQVAVHVQGGVWGEFTLGATALLFPVTVFLPILFLSIKEGTGSEKTVGVVALLLSAVAIMISSSRATLIPFAVVSMLGMFFLGVRKGVSVLFVLGTFALIVGSSLSTLESTRVVAIIDDSIRVGYELLFVRELEEIRGLDRLLHLQVAWTLITENLSHFFFGFGFRAEGQYMAPELAALYFRLLPHLDFERELGDGQDVVTFGISSLIAGTGLTGAVLLSLCVLLALREVSRYSRGSWRLMLLASLAFVFARLYGNNFLTYPLLYFAVMPNGLFVYLARLHSQHRSREAVKGEGVRRPHIY